MRRILILLVWLSCAEWANAASLVWEYGGSNVPATATIQRGATATGAFTTIATIPSTPALYPLPATPDNQFYRVQNTAGVSNVVQYTANPSPPIVSDARIAAIETKVSAIEAKNAAQDSTLGGLGSALVAVEGRITMADTTNVAQDTALAGLTQRVTALETAPPPPTGSNLMVKDLNTDQIEITGVNCTSLKTTGTGLKRVITCVH